MEVIVFSYSQYSNLGLVITCKETRIVSGLPHFSSTTRKSSQLRSPHLISSYQMVNISQLPGSSDGKESACNAGDLGLIPELGRSPGEGNDYPLQYSCLENSMDIGAWRATVVGVAKSWSRLSDFELPASKISNARLAAGLIIFSCIYIASSIV